MSNVKYSFSSNGLYAIGKLPDDTEFLIDANRLDEIKDINFYVCGKTTGQLYITDSEGTTLHHHLYEHRKGYEIDHVNNNTFDNRKCNIRYCTHQENQINQPLQKNNTSGVSGVSWYPARKKYRARIKISQKDIHLGYYDSFENAVQARNVGMECMFGEYGQYNKVASPPDWIRENVVEKCMRFADLSVCKAFLINAGVV